MKLTSAFRAWKTIKPHVPLIKFRKGGLLANDPRLTGAHGGNVPPPVTAASASPPKQPPPPASVAQSVTKSPATIQRPVIYDYELPARYRRQPLSQSEIDYINRGGPDCDP